MQRYVLLAGVSLILAVSTVSGQVRKHFSVENTREFKQIHINYSNSSGVSYIGPVDETYAITVYGNKDIDEYVHDFDKKVESKTCYIDLKIDEKSPDGFNQSISNSFFSSSKSNDEAIWKVFFTEDKPYDLNLNFGIGDAMIDLSGLSISNMKINTGSADVRIAYMNEIPNPIVMDTFHIKADLGSLNIHQTLNTRAKVIVADVGFGNVFMDLTDRVLTSGSIIASVGAGNFEVVVPKSETPIKIRLTNSLLCQVKLPKRFTAIDSDTYVTESYDEDAENKLEFDIDVSLGSILFKEK